MGRLWVFAFLAAAVASTMVASRLDAAVFNPRTFTLANGMKVVVIENHRIPAVTHMVWYKAGAADEPRGKSGVAHYLEHLMFKGTRVYGPGEFSRLVAVNGGRENAFTTHDYTAYHQTVARDRLELVMKLEADRMTHLTLSPKLAKPELQVVLEERRMRIDNDPGSQLDEQVRAALFLHHPYGIPVIGWEPEIKELTASDALAFYRARYAPNNAILVIAGDITLEEVKPLAEKYYGAIAAHPIPPRARGIEPAPITKRRVVLESDRVRRPSFTRSYLAPSYRMGEPGQAYALAVLSEILGGGGTSRLYRSLVIEQKVAVGAGTAYDPDVRDLARFSVYVSPRDGVELSAIEAAVDAEIARLLADGVSDDEIARAKKRLQANAIYARDSLQTGARVLGATLALDGTVEEVETWPERIGAVTAAEVAAAARFVLEPTRSVTGFLVPGGKS
ncbi:MAG: pitrilysin family protein [Alphaproteobacteria bacterium]